VGEIRIHLQNPGVFPFQGRAKALDDGAPVAEFPLAVDHRNLRTRGCQGVGHRARPVGGGVIDDHYVEGEVEPQQPVGQLLETVAFVIDRWG
jgi:hypothetical protein